MLQLCTHRFLVPGQIRGDSNELRRDEDSRHRDTRACEQDRDGGSRRLPDTSACELALERGKHEAQDAGKRNGRKDLAAHVQQRKNACRGYDPGGT